MRKIIVDLTKATPGTETGLINRVQDSYRDIVAEDILIVQYPWQRVLSDQKFNHVVLPQGLHYLRVAEAVYQELQSILNLDSESTSVLVFSLHSSVFKLVERLPLELKPRVSFIAFSRLHFGPASGTEPWGLTWITIDDAITLLKKVLIDQDATSREKAVRKTDLRFMLARIDQRFQKENTNSVQPGLISNLLRAAVSRNIAQLDDSDHLNPYVWIPLERAPVATEKAQPRPREKLEERRASRSQDFLDALKSHRLGPFSKIRQRLFDAMDQIVMQKPTVGELLSQIIRQVQFECKDNGGSGGAYPWRKVRDFLTELLTRTPVLLDVNKSPITISFENYSTQVVSLIENWRVILEGELILGLVRAGVGLRLTDMQALAGALFLSRTEETEARTVRIIEHLIKSGTIVDTETSDHQRLLALPTSSVVVPLHPDLKSVR